MARVLKAILLGVAGLVCAIIIVMIAKIAVAISFELFGWWSAGAYAVFVVTAFAAIAYSADDADA